MNASRYPVREPGLPHVTAKSGSETGIVPNKKLWQDIIQNALDVGTRRIYVQVATVAKIALKGIYK